MDEVADLVFATSSPACGDQPGMPQRPDNGLRSFECHSPQPDPSPGMARGPPCITPAGRVTILFHRDDETMTVTALTGAVVST